MKTVFGSEIINFIRIIKDIKGDKIDKGNQKYSGIFFLNHHITYNFNNCFGSRWLIKIFFNN